MKVQTLGRTTSLEEPPRSTAYYYADLERFRKKPIVEAENHVVAPRLDNDVINDGPIREVPPFRDRPSPEYQTPENSRMETYSTAGTFPLAEVGPSRGLPGPLREKEPLLLELEEIGRLPLRELSHSGVRRSRSWYLCCEEREERPAPAPWRYATLAPVTRPPPPHARPQGFLVASTSSGAGADDPLSLRAERDALARALAAERARAAAEARAHDARLAELHGVIAELVRRRAQDKNASAIPEEQLSDECESTTQPCGELDDDCSRTEQNDTSSALSLQPTPQDPRPDDSTSSPPNDRCSSSNSGGEGGAGGAVGAGSSGDSCGRERGSTPALRAPPTGWCGRRQAKVAARVRLKRSQDADARLTTVEEIRRALGEEPDLEALSAHSDDESCARGAWWRARALRLAGDRAVLAAALARATDTAHRLSCACAVQESSSVALCCALQAADRALETYDVLLALAETAHADHAQRQVAERVARGLLGRLEAEESAAPAIGRTLLSPGPWLQGESCAYALDCGAEPPPAQSQPMAVVEGRLREHAARLKAATVSLRNLTTPPALFTYHDGEDEGGAGGGGGGNMADMEVAVAMQELLIAREAEAAERVTRLASSAGRPPPALPPSAPAHAPVPPAAAPPPRDSLDCKVHGSAERKCTSTRRQRHWLDSQQTDL